MINPDKVAFSLFGRDIYWFAVMIILAGIAAFVVTSILAKKKKVSKDEVIDLTLWILPLSLICSRLYYVLCNLPEFLNNPISILYIWNGGLALPGAILGGALGAFLCSRFSKRRFLRYADLLIPGVLLAQAIGRWGDFFNQTSYGPQITDPGQLWFPLGVLIDSSRTCHYALFFYDFIFCLILFAIVLLLFKRMRHDGDIMLIYLVGYSLVRIFLEALRVDPLMIGDVLVTQVLAMAALGVSLIFIIVRYIAERKTHKLLWPEPEPDTKPSIYSEMEETTARTLERQSADVDSTPKPEDIPDFVADREDFRKFGVTLAGDDTGAVKLEYTFDDKDDDESEESEESEDTDEPSSNDDNASEDEPSNVSESAEVEPEEDEKASETKPEDDKKAGSKSEKDTKQKSEKKSDENSNKKTDNNSNKKPENAKSGAKAKKNNKR